MNARNWIFVIIVIFFLGTITGRVVLINKHLEVIEKEMKKPVVVQLAPTQEALITITAYTARKEECNKDPQKTAIMTKPKVGRTIAVSHDLIHWLGGWVYISGVGIRKAEDLMNERFTMKMDLLVGSVSEATKWGEQEHRVVFLGR